MCAGFLSYLGPFSFEYRQYLMDDVWMANIKENNIPVSTTFRLGRLPVLEASLEELSFQSLRLLEELSFEPVVPPPPHMGCGAAEATGLGFVCIKKFSNFTLPPPPPPDRRLTSEVQVTQWASEGLPPDDLSLQNGILTVRASK